MSTAEMLQEEAADDFEAVGGDQVDVAFEEALSEDLGGEFEEMGEDALQALADEGAEELGDVEALDELGDGFEDLSESEGAEFDALSGEACEQCDVAVEDFDELGEFAFRPSSGLYVPAKPRLLQGETALRMASRLNPLLLEQLSADDADEFFKNARRAFRGIARGVGRSVSSVARAAPGLLRAVGPLVSQALPLIQSVAAKVGPWGLLASSGLGAARGLISGKGLSGALQGALSGATAGIPGLGAIMSKLGGARNLLGGLSRLAGGGGPLRSILGTLAPSGGSGGGLAGMLGGLLSGDGADDDADLDALADMADAALLPPALALPLGAALAARTVARRGCPISLQLPANRARLWNPARAAERTLLHAASHVRGSAGRRLRVMRAIARLASHILRRRGGSPRALPSTVRFAANRILALTGGAPSIGRVSPQIARSKLAARERILRHVPVSALYPAHARLATAAA